MNRCLRDQFNNPISFSYNSYSSELTLGKEVFSLHTKDFHFSQVSLPTKILGKAAILSIFLYFQKEFQLRYDL